MAWEFLGTFLGKKISLYECFNLFFNIDNTLQHPFQLLNNFARNWPYGQFFLSFVFGKATLKLLSLVPQLIILLPNEVNMMAKEKAVRELGSPNL